MRLAWAGDVLHLGERAVVGAAHAVTASMTENMTPSIVERSAASSTCAAGNNSSYCEKPVSTNGLVIGLAAGIPACVALIVLFFLQRRIRRKLRAEDANDKYKSLDFGMDAVQSGGKGRKGSKKMPEMSVAETGALMRPGLHSRNMSMEDIALGNPFLLPAAVHGSRESLHSMSRAMVDPHDPYRPVTFIKSDQDSSSTRTRTRTDNASTYTGSSGRTNHTANAELLKNAARMSRTDPPGYNSRSDLPAYKSSISRENSSKLGQGYGSARKPVQLTDSNDSDRWYPSDDKENQAFPERKESVDKQNDFERNFDLNNHTLPPLPPPVQQSQRQEQNRFYEQGVTQPAMPVMYNTPDVSAHIAPPTPTYDRYAAPPTPTRFSPEATAVPKIQEPDQDYYAPPQDAYVPQDLAIDQRRVSVMGLRPLPPDDPTDNPEQRANRIRSFYKEYFDDSRPNPAGQYPRYSMYDDGYVADFLEDGAVYDPETGAFFTTGQAPFAEPVERRAMTPPPRGAAPFARGHRSAASTQSAGRGLRPFYPAPGSGAPLPKKRAPPPKALTSLPTPHMLRDDMSLSAIEFAPRQTFRDVQMGRGLDSPIGSARPYSPAFSAHLPLATSFDDLNVMPSPHVLRKSGTFTALDFAPPTRFRNEGAGSDAGSIKSNRSGMSALQREMVRAGAYRVSRMPKETVGTTDDFKVALKPQWEMRGN